MAGRKMFHLVFPFCFKSNEGESCLQMCDLDERLEKCEHFSNRIIVEQNLDVCQFCLQNLYKFRGFPHFSANSFANFLSQKTCCRVESRLVQ